MASGHPVLAGATSTSAAFHSSLEADVSPASTNRLSEILAQHEGQILDRWVQEQRTAFGQRRGLMSDAELREQSREFLGLVRQAAQAGGTEIDGGSWSGVREFLTRVSASRAVQGFSPSETATFVFSLKQPVFEQLRREEGASEGLLEEVWRTNQLIDRLGLFTTEVHQRGREQVILRQQEEMLELSTPVVKLWDGVLALPMIGTLDSARTQVVMEALLQRIVETGASVAIIDITGVPTVDTLVAQHLLKTITAARLMGADCIISGIRPQIAATIVHLGVDLSDVITKATLADAFALALERMGLAVGRVVRRS
jgi:rsbT co-antagonist protein RsbR